MAIVCYKCGEEIRGMRISTNPPPLAQIIAHDFPKSYHPECYDQQRKEDAKELWPDEKNNN